MREALFFCATIIAIALGGRLGAAEGMEDENARLARRLVAVVRNGALPTAARVGAAKALGLLGIGGRAAVPDLANVLADRNRAYPFALDEALVRALGQMGAPAREAIPVLVQNMGRDCDLDRAIQESVGQIVRSSRAPVAVAVLIDLLRSPVVTDRLRAAKGLAAMGVEARDAVRALHEALTDVDGDVRRQAFRALLAIQPGVPPSRGMLGALVRDLTDTSEVVRLAAAKALGQFGPAARFALPALQAAARSDPDDDVRRVAGDAVGRITGSRE